MTFNPALAELNAVIDSTPIIDNHAHPLLKKDHLDKPSLLALASEAHGDALQDSRTSLAHFRATRQLAQLLGCEETWEVVESTIRSKRREFGDVWTKHCLQGIQTILIDDGLDGADQVDGYAAHDAYTVSPCKRIVRIEMVAADIIKQKCQAFTEPDYPNFRQQVFGALHDELTACVADPDVVGFKSVICYRGGLDVCSKQDAPLGYPHNPNSEASTTTTPDSLTARAHTILDGILEEHLGGEKSFVQYKRVQHGALNHILVHLAASIIQNSPSPHKKPIQFHTGLGDNDITLTKSSPSHLQTFISEYPTVPIVLLHGGYPWTREMSYLATMYTNVYADIGEVFPFLDRNGQCNVVKQTLELCPWSKVLWSTDGHWFPEYFLLTTTQVRSVLKTVVGDLVKDNQLGLEPAIQLVRDILYNNSNKLYNLQLDSAETATAAAETTAAATKLTGGGLTTTTTTTTLLQQPPPPHPWASNDDDGIVGIDWPAHIVTQKLRTADPNARWLRVYWHDFTASTKCRLVPMKQVYRALEEEKKSTCSSSSSSSTTRAFRLSITKACFGLLQMDMAIPGVSATGVYNVYPDWSTVRPGPVSSGHLSCFAEFRDGDDLRPGHRDGEDSLCPRTLLRKTVEEISGWGSSSSPKLDFLLGFEIEFVVLERNPRYRYGGDSDDSSSKQKEPKYLPLHSFSEGHAWSMARSLADWGRPGSFLSAVDEILELLEKGGIEPEQFHAESAPGQYELVLPARRPLEACDALVYAKQVIESVSARHGYRVTCHPKPFADKCGSACHAHLSVSTTGRGEGTTGRGMEPRSAEGAEHEDDEDGTPAEVYKSFYAGILGRLPSLLALTYAGPFSSWDRAVDSFWAGGRWVTWGKENKEAPLRKIKGAHWEIKTVDGLANPYFVAAGLLAAGADGIRKGMELKWKECTGDPAALDDAGRKELGIDTKFPAEGLSGALDLLEKGDVKEWLGERFVERYVKLKRAEIEFQGSLGKEERREWVLERY